MDAGSSGVEGDRRGALGRSVGSISHRSFCGLVLVSGDCGNRNSLGPERMAPPRHIGFCCCMVGLLPGLVAAPSALQLGQPRWRYLADSLAMVIYLRNCIWYGDCHALHLAGSCCLFDFASSCIRQAFFSIGPEGVLVGFSGIRAGAGMQARDQSPLSAAGQPRRALGKPHDAWCDSELGNMECASALSIFHRNCNYTVVSCVKRQARTSTCCIVLLKAQKVMTGRVGFRSTRHNDDVFRADCMTGYPEAILRRA